MQTVQRAPTTISNALTLMFYSFSTLYQDPSVCLSFHFLLFSLCSFLFLIKIRSHIFVWIVDPFVSQIPREFYGSHFPEQILDFAYTLLKLLSLA